MNMTAIDITDHNNVKQGEEVVLLGAQGQEVITAADIAGELQTIPYEVLCWVGSQFPRRCLSKDGLAQ
jgi:alanine racemase